MGLGSFDATVRLWDCKSHSTKPIQVLEEAKDSVSSVIVDGHEIATGSVDGRVRLYDLRMGQVYVDVIGRESSLPFPKPLLASISFPPLRSALLTILQQIPLPPSHPPTTPTLSSSPLWTLPSASSTRATARSSNPTPPTGTPHIASVPVSACMMRMW